MLINAVYFNAEDLRVMRTEWTYIFPIILCFSYKDQKRYTTSLSVNCTGFSYVICFPVGSFDIWLLTNKNMTA